MIVLKQPTSWRPATSAGFLIHPAVIGGVAYGHG